MVFSGSNLSGLIGFADSKEPSIQKLCMRRGEKFAARVGIVLIIVMGSLLVYVILHYDEIRQEQVYQTTQQLNAR